MGGNIIHESKHPFPHFSKDTSEARKSYADHIKDSTFPKDVSVLWHVKVTLGSKLKMADSDFQHENMCE